MKKISKLNFDLKTPFAQRLFEIASVEASAIVDLYGSAPGEAFAISIHHSLHVTLCHIEQAVFFPTLGLKSSNSARHPSDQLKKRMRFELIAAINECADEVIAQAHSAFCTAATSNVLIEVVYAADELTGAPYLIDSSGLHSEHHGEAFESLRSIRRQPFDVQLMLTKYAPLVETVSFAEGMVEPSVVDAASKRVAEFKSGHTRPAVAAEVLESVTNFYWSMVYGAFRADAIPICLDPNASAITIRDVAQNFLEFGAQLRLFEGAVFHGEASECVKAKKAWSRYQSGGVALKVLGGWLRALAFDPRERFCDLCYRHAAAKKRCAEHATSHHETREGRLGKAIRPSYLARARVLRQLPPVQRVLGTKLSGGNLEISDDEVLSRAVSTLSVSPKLRGRIKLLASQLRNIHDLLDEQMRNEMQLIFLTLVTIANDAYEIAAPRSLSEEWRKQQQIQFANELISLKGFFKCWYSGPKSKGQENGAPRGAYDTRHPVVTLDQLDPTALAVQLLFQRAWTEAERSYRRQHHPDGDVVAEMIEGGLNLKEAASSLGYSYSGIRALMRRWKNHEERQRYRRRLN